MRIAKMLEVSPTPPFFSPVQTYKTLQHRENRVLNNAEFLRKFVRARKVCPHTADDVIVKLEDRAISPDIALEVTTSPETT